MVISYANLEKIAKIKLDVERDDKSVMSGSFLPSLLLLKCYQIRKQKKKTETNHKNNM